LPSGDGYLLTETCKSIYTYKYILITLDGVIKIILIVLVDVLNSISACIFCFQKKRVWFPDPEVSDTLLFYAHDTVESAAGRMTGRQSPCSQTYMLPNNRRRRRRWHASFSSDTDVHDESHVSTHSANLNGIYGCAKGKTEFAIDIEFQNANTYGKEDVTRISVNVRFACVSFSLQEQSDEKCVVTQEAGSERSMGKIT
jgi:hypothetical protein